MFNNTCCFIGHREIEETEELREKLKNIIEGLITSKGVDTFLFGSKSRFNSLSYGLVTELKTKYPNIKRVYVRAEYPDISHDYKEYLLSLYEDTYYPEKAVGRAVYIERNREMIDKSEYCVFYYRKDRLPTARKSGTLTALSYAVSKKREITILSF